LFYLEQKNVNDILFKKGLGYIDATLIKYPDKDTIAVYYVSPQLHGYTNESIDWSYPDFYSYINNRLVLISVIRYIPSQSEDIRKSKKFLRGLVDKCLEKKKR
jgi:hypothetical protein